MQITLNAEQTKRFLSCFIQEAIELARKRLSAEVNVEASQSDGEQENETS